MPLLKGQMNQPGADILIIGAGVTGLVAARALSAAENTVTIIEARDRCGGRIHTINKEAIPEHLELGAEFVHGDLPVTLNLLKEAGIHYYSAGGEMWHFRNGKFSSDDVISKDWGLLMEKLDAVKEDISIAAFLQTYFPGDEHTGLRNAVLRFAAGYDTADPMLASTFALRQEWQNEDEGAQYRVAGGYGTVINYLENECKNNGCKINLNAIAKEITWNKHDVTVLTSEGIRYQAKKVIIALPLGVLQSEAKVASILFSPQIPEQSHAINVMGFGAIIKVLLKFDEVFWNQANGTDLKNMGFILSEEAIPTWWTQAPQKSNILTGWLGGPGANAHKDSTNEELLASSLQSLANIFNIPTQKLKEKLIGSEIVNWTADPFTLGSYAYDTVGASVCRNILNKPVEDTIYFAGEYLYEGAAMGTVEAALTSGLNVAKYIINSKDYQVPNNSPT